MATINLKRLHQAIDLLPRLREGGLGLKEAVTLQYLARCMNEKTVPGTLAVEGSCFPSLDRIAEETFQCERSVRRALDNLLARGYLTKSKIPGRLLRGPAAQNKYEGNRYHVTPLWDAAPKNAAATEPVKAPPPAPPVSTKGDEAPATKIDQQEGEKLFSWLRAEFRDQPSMQDPNSERYFRGFIRAALADALEAQDVIAVWETLPQRTKDTVRGKEKLGGYLAQCWAGWWPIYMERVFADVLVKARAMNAGGDVEFGVTGWLARSTSQLREYIERKVGDDGLERFDTEETEEDVIVTLRFSESLGRAPEAQPQPDYRGPYVDPASDPVGLETDALFNDPDTVEASDDVIQQWMEEQRNQLPPDEEDEL